MKKVIAVVVTYNRKEMLLEALQALKNISYSALEIFVVDNFSTDGTKEFISSLVDDEKVRYFNTGANLGGAGGFNYGMRKAIEEGCDYIWVMDDDCIVRQDSLDFLLKKAESLQDDFGYLSSSVRWTDGNPCKMNIQKVSMKKKVEDFSKDQKIVMATFVSLFINAKVAIEVGLPIKEFFIWGDDLEYTYRISWKYPCYYCASSIVDHKCKDNLGSSLLNDDQRIDRYFYAYRNEAYLFRNAGLKGRIYYFLKILYHKAKIRLKSCNFKKEKMAVLKKGVKAGKAFNPKIEYAYPMERKVRVLEFFGEPLSFGGQEAFMLNMYENFGSRNEYTLATPFELTNQKLIHIAEKRGEKILFYNYPFESKKRKEYIRKALNDILKKNHYDVIHIQSGSIFTLLKSAKIAKKHGIRKVIVHSHCCGNDNFKYRLIKEYSDRRITSYADGYLACSMAAGKWKFPQEIIDQNEMIVIKNGIITKDYLFNQETRDEIRKQLGIRNDEITFVHVGRFSEMKNHAFFYKLLPLIKEHYPDFRFIFVGAGELKEGFKNKIKEMNLDNHILYLENIDYVNKVLMAGDLFLFPSLYEGFPMTLVESQASGLITLFSDMITKECILTDNIVQLPLDEKKWIEEIDNQIQNRLNKFDRKIYAEEVASKGYDAKTSASLLERIYRGE